jgi:hypothetical protein
MARWNSLRSCGECSKSPQKAWVITRSSPRRSSPSSRHNCSASITQAAPRGLAVPHQRVGDVARHPFLVGEAVADGVDQAGDAAEAVQAAARQVGDVGDAAERHQVVRADAMDGDAADTTMSRRGSSKPSPSASPGRDRSRRAGAAARARARAARCVPCAALSGAMPQARSRSATARSKAAASKAFWRGMPIVAVLAPAGSGLVAVGHRRCFIRHG